jgi:hypothetical protein
MDFLIADTFTSSLARLKGDEQKAVKTTAFDLQCQWASKTRHRWPRQNQSLEATA